MVEELSCKTLKTIIKEAELAVKESGPSGTPQETSGRAAHECERIAGGLLKEGNRITSDIISDWGTVPSLRTDIEEDIET